MRRPTPVLADIAGARPLLILGHNVTTDHISPGGAIPEDAPAGQYLIAHGVPPAQFGTYVGRRANHEVMVRGTFANIRLRNAMAPGTEGGFTRLMPKGEVTTVYEAAERYRADGVPSDRRCRRQLRLRIVSRLGGQGHATSGHSRDRGGELRADPPQQPDRHGRHPPAIPVRSDRRRAWRSTAPRRSTCTACPTALPRA